MAIDVTPLTGEKILASETARLVDLASHGESYTETGITVSSTSSLDVTFNTGTALITGTKVELTSTETVTVNDGATNWVFLGDDGTWNVQTGGSQPATPADHTPIAKVVASGGSIDSTSDIRATLSEFPSVTAEEAFDAGDPVQVTRASSEARLVPVGGGTSPETGTPETIATTVWADRLTGCWVTDTVLFLAYDDNSDLTGRMAEITETGWNFGSETQIEANVDARADSLESDSINEDRVAITFSRSDDNDTELAICTVDPSNLSITVEDVDELQFGFSTETDVKWLDNNHLVAAWGQDTNQGAFAALITWAGSGNAWSNADEVSFETSSDVPLASLAKLSEDQVALIYFNSQDADHEVVTIDIDRGNDTLSSNTVNTITASGDEHQDIDAIDSSTIVVMYNSGSGTPGEIWVEIGNVDASGNISFGAFEDTGQSVQVNQDRAGYIRALGNGVLMLMQEVASGEAANISGSDEIQAIPMTFSGQTVTVLEATVAWSGISNTFSMCPVRGGTMAISADDQFRLVRAYGSIDGSVRSSVTAGNSTDLVTPGSVNDGFSGLTAGNRYYMHTPGHLVTFDTGFEVGVALSSTEMLIS